MGGTVEFKIKDGNGGTSLAAGVKRIFLVGIIAAGVPGTLYAYTSGDDLVDELVGGPTVELAASILDNSDAEVVLSPAEIVIPGAVGSVAHAGTSISQVTFSGTPIDAYDLVVKMTKAGGLGTSQYQWSDDAGTTWSAVKATPGGGSELLGTTGVTAHFDSAGAPYVASAVTPSGHSQTLSAISSFGTIPPVITATGVLLESIDLHVEVTDIGGGAARGQWIGRWSIDGGSTWTGFTSAATVAVGSTGITLNIATGNAAVNNVWRASTTTGAPPVITLTGTPLGVYGIVVQCTTAGARGTWLLRWSKDGGSTWEASGVPSAATVALTGTGLTANIATGVALTDNVWQASTVGSSPYVAADTWSASCSAPSASTATLGAALDEIIADERVFTFGMVVGSALGDTDADRADATSDVIAATDAKVQAAETDGTFLHVIVDGPIEVNPLTPAGLTSYESALGAVLSTVVSLDGRVSVGAGSYPHLSAINARTRRRSTAWAAIIHAAKGEVSQSIAEVERGALGPFARRPISLDTRRRPTLDAARCMTLRTWKGKPGLFFNTAATLAAPGSDFDMFHAGTVMDLACATMHPEIVRFIDVRLRLDAAGTGKISSTVADTIDLELNTQLESALAGHVTSSSVKVNRNDVLRTTKELRIEVELEPLFYPRKITTTLRYKVPATLVAAA